MPTNPRHMIAAAILAGAVIAAGAAGHANATGPVWCQKHPTRPACVDHATTTTTVPTSPPTTVPPSSTTTPVTTATTVPTVPPSVGTVPTPPKIHQRLLPPTGAASALEWTFRFALVVFVGGAFLLIVRRWPAS